MICAVQIHVLLTYLLTYKVIYELHISFYLTFVLQVLVRYHISINEKNSNSNTALHLAAAHHHPKIVELLLSVGANPFTENNDRSKPVDLVPESDSVTRQMLKSAMANPRPAPLDASMLSLRKDLHNLSMMPGVNMPAVLAQKPAGTLGHESMAVPNGIPPGFAANHVPGANRSFRTMSSTSSVFVDDTKARLGALQFPNQPSREHERNNAIPLYTPVDKLQNTSTRHGHGTGSHQTSLDRSIVPPSPSRGETKRRSGRGKQSSASPNNRDSVRSQKHGKPSMDSQNYQDLQQSQMVEKKNRANRQSDSGAAAMPPLADRSLRKSHQHYENMSFDNSREHSGSGRKSRSKKDKRPKERSSKAAEYATPDEDDEVEDFPSGYYDDDAGVKVHTVPGKPSTIEVEYTGGPIMISVDTQGDSLESVPTRDQTSDSSSSSSSSSSDEVRVSRHNRSVDALEQKKKKKKAKKHKKKHREQEVQSADEVLERRDKKKHRKKSKEEPIYANQPRKKKDRGRDKETQSADEMEEKPSSKLSSRRSEDEPVYANQSQILAEMRRQQEERIILEEQQRLEQERLDREAERERTDEAEAKRVRHEERERRKAKKLQRRQQRQNIEEPEPPVFLEAKPSLSYPKEMWAEPEYDSDDVEKEQHNVVENAKRRAIAAAHSLIQRWSEAEDDQEPQDFLRGNKYSSAVKEGITGSYEKPKKPPRPAVSPQRFEEDLDLLPDSVEESTRMPTANPVPRPRTTISQSKMLESDMKYETSMQEMESAGKMEAGKQYETVMETKKDTETEDQKYETVMREVDTKTNIELTTVAILSHKDAKWVDAKLMEQPEHYAQEVVIPDSQTIASLDPDVEKLVPAQHRGLKMRVTGEMPKAYSRGEKDSARKAFMLAPPVGIESSSEASDSELSSPMHSAPEPTPAWDCQRQAEPEDDMEPLPQDSAASKDGSKLRKLPLYAKPYRSFGKIEPKVDALEEALKEEKMKKKWDSPEQRVPVPNIQGMMQYMLCFNQFTVIYEMAPRPTLLGWTVGQM